MTLNWKKGVCERSAHLSVRSRSPVWRLVAAAAARATDSPGMCGVARASRKQLFFSEREAHKNFCDSLRLDVLSPSGERQTDKRSFSSLLSPPATSRCGARAPQTPAQIWSWEVHRDFRAVDHCRKSRHCELTRYGPKTVCLCRIVCNRQLGK